MPPCRRDSSLCVKASRGDATVRAKVQLVADAPPEVSLLRTFAAIETRIAGVEQECGLALGLERPMVMLRACRGVLGPVVVLKAHSWDQGDAFQR